jgi:3',5'-cyclic-AMP phosphodiesterase
MDKTNHKPLNVLQISDSHLLDDPEGTLLGLKTQQTFEETLQHAIDNHAPFDLVLATGDIVQDASTAGYERFLQGLSQYNIPTYCLPGNHDDPALMKRILNTDLIHYKPHTIIQGWLFIFLDSCKTGSAGGLISEKTLLRVEETLKTYPDHPAVICMHHPMVAVGSEWLDTMKIDNGEVLSSSLDRFKQIKLVLCGHIHQEFSQQFNNFPLLALPSTCIQFLPKSKGFALDKISPGYRWLQFGNDGTLVTAIERSGVEPTSVDFASAGY